MDPIEIAIQKALEVIPKTPRIAGWSDTLRTREVKRALVRVAKANGWQTAANQCEDADEKCEWLYDVLCYRADEGKESMTEVPLVAESEWGEEGAIVEDFDKLLVARATYRVMVFRADSPKSVDDLVEKMRKRIENFRGTAGDRFLFAGWVGNPESRFFFKLHVVDQSIPVREV